MKKQLISRLCACLVVALCGMPLMAQGVIVYQKDGTKVKFPYELIDSIVTYNHGEEVEDEPVTPPATAPAGVEAVDLGLSVKWASCNVGAESPEEYGGYYAWGETEEKTNYSLSTYKWCNGSNDSQTKYCTSSSYGTVDNKTTLDPEDDVAHVKWGGTWRMPTIAEQDELLSKCSWSWTSVNGVNGYRVTGPNGNSIFLPAAGYRYGGDVYDSGSFGGFWSATLDSGESCYACGLDLDDGYYDWEYYNRYCGLSVRPVTE